MGRGKASSERGVRAGPVGRPESRNALFDSLISPRADLHDRILELLELRARAAGSAATVTERRPSRARGESRTSSSSMQVSITNRMMGGPTDGTAWGGVARRARRRTRARARGERRPPNARAERDARGGAARACSSYSTVVNCGISSAGRFCCDRGRPVASTRRTGRRARARRETTDLRDVLRVVRREVVARQAKRARPQLRAKVDLRAGAAARVSAWRRRFRSPAARARLAVRVQDGAAAVAANRIVLQRRRRALDLFERRVQAADRHDHARRLEPRRRPHLPGEPRSVALLARHKVLRERIQSVRIAPPGSARATHPAHAAVRHLQRAARTRAGRLLARARAERYETPRVPHGGVRG